MLNLRTNIILQTINVKPVPNHSLPIKPKHFYTLTMRYKVTVNLLVVMTEYHPIRNNIFNYHCSSVSFFSKYSHITEFHKFIIII